MLKILGFSIVVLVALAAAFVVWRILATVLGSQRRTMAVLEEMRSVLEALDEGREPDAAEIWQLAAEPRTRNLLYESLAEHGSEDLFPAEYTTGQAVAESDLVFWLCHPNELQSSPDEIECMGSFTRTLEPTSLTGRYYLFRYRVKPPHWAADDGWMAGVAGPHVEGSEPGPAARGTFSDFASWESRSPEEHVDAVHHIMMVKGAYAGLDEEPAESDA